MKLILLSLLLVGVSHGSPRHEQCNILRSSPFMRSTNTEDLQGELEFLVEFSRFMNYKTPALLQEFVAFKSMRLSKDQLRNRRSKRNVNDKLRQLRPDAVFIVEDNGDEKEKEDALANIVNSTAVLTQEIANVLGESTENVIDLLQAILEGAGSVASEVLPSNIWNYLCIATWYPIHEERCKETKCAACAPAIMSAAAACQKGRSKVTHSCIQEVMGEGSCNYCIKDFLEN